MKCQLIGQRSNAIFNPLRVWSGMGRDKNAGENLGRAILGLVDAPVETVGAIAENLLYRIPASFIKPSVLHRQATVGYLDIPGRLETENLLARVDPESLLRQEFVDQYSDRYGLHRLDINVTPVLLDGFSGHRIMDMELFFLLAPPIQCTDVYPQTKWEREGLRVGDRVFLNAVGHYTPRLGKSDDDPMEPAQESTCVTCGREYFYEVSYETLVPTVEGRALNDGFSWRLRGTYERYIECGTKRLTAVLLVPKGVGEVKCQIAAKVGITDADRRDSTYPPSRKLMWAVMAGQAVMVELGSST